MSITDRSRQRVDRVLDRLREDYGEFAVVEKTWEYDTETMGNLRDRFEGEGLDGGGVWITNDAGEVLLVRNEGDVDWFTEPPESVLYEEVRERPYPAGTR